MQEILFVLSVVELFIIIGLIMSRSLRKLNKPKITSLIKESTGEMVVVRLNHYGHQLEYFFELFEVAQKDFPKLKLEDVEVVHYGGSRYSGYWGIEFKNPNGNICPDGYTQIDTLEFVR